MKPKLITMFVLIAMLSLGGVVMAESLPPTTTVGVVPVLRTDITTGNAVAECAQIGEYDFAYKVDDWSTTDPNGTYVHEGQTITVVSVADGEGEYKTFDWTVNPYPLGAVMVKAATGYLVYFYEGASADTGLYGPNNQGISHATFCWNADMDYEELTVSKTVVTSFTREHFWDIAKEVDTDNDFTHNDFPKIWLYIDGSGDETATWTVDVTYEGYKDSDFNVSGVITVTNTGTLDAVITSVIDVLGGTTIAVDCGVTFPYTLPVDKTLTCSYDEDVDSKIEGNNVVTVTTERDNYSATKPIVWGAPTTEINKTVTISDLSDLFGTLELGTVTAPTGDTFTYTMDFAWADYGQDLCGDYIYDNTATIVETGQYADATLLVNVQCYIYETAYAKGAYAICFIPTFKNWGWTNPIGPDEYTWKLWAGAAKCDTTKGTLVGSVTVAYDAYGNVTVKFNVAAPYLLEETHVYAGYAQFPKDSRGKNTVAPGQYTNASPFGLQRVYVIAHAVVGMPDPNFGP